MYKIIFFGLEIENTTRVYKILLKFFGLSFNSKLNYILKKFGIKSITTFDMLSKETRYYLEDFLYDNLKLNNLLWTKYLDNIGQYNYSITKSYRGLRSRQKLPSKGQRTHTNAKTAKRTLEILAFMKRRQNKKRTKLPYINLKSLKKGVTAYKWKKKYKSNKKFNKNYEKFRVFNRSKFKFKRTRSWGRIKFLKHQQHVLRKIKKYKSRHFYVAETRTFFNNN